MTTSRKRKSSKTRDHRKAGPAEPTAETAAHRCDVILEKMRQQEAESEQKFSTLMGRQRALYAKAGVDITSGSPLLVLADAAMRAEAERRAAEKLAPALPKIAGSRKDQIDAFIAGVFKKTGKAITRTNIWTAAGYKDRTQFERYQKNSRSTDSAKRNFDRILQMKPEEFNQHLERMQKQNEK